MKRQLLLFSVSVCVAWTTSLRASDVPKRLPAADLSRRTWMVGISSTLATAATLPARAAEENSNLRDFVDPQGLFTIQVPEDFYTIRRTQKGDLPDEKTGKGRRGSSIFTAGNLKKAIVVAVERFPTSVLLQENGIEASGSLATFSDLGESAAIANLLNLRREKDKPGMSNSQILPESVVLSSDKKELSFRVKSEIEVQKPELLMETYGVDRLFRITEAKASLRSSDGNLLAVFASALEKDFEGSDGAVLVQSVKSFQATEREFGF